MFSSRCPATDNWNPMLCTVQSYNGFSNYTRTTLPLLRRRCYKSCRIASINTNTNWKANPNPNLDRFHSIQPWTTRTYPAWPSRLSNGLQLRNRVRNSVLGSVDLPTLLRRLTWYELEYVATFPLLISRTPFLPPFSAFRT